MRIGNAAAAGWTIVGYYDFGYFNVTGDGRLIAADPCYLRDAYQSPEPRSCMLGFTVKMQPGCYHGTSLLGRYGTLSHARSLDVHIERVDTNVRFFPTKHPLLEIIPGQPARTDLHQFDDNLDCEVAVDSGTVVLLDRARITEDTGDAILRNQKIGPGMLLPDNIGIFVSSGLGDGLYDAGLLPAQIDEHDVYSGIHIQFVTFGNEDDQKLQVIGANVPTRANI